MKADLLVTLRLRIVQPPPGVRWAGRIRRFSRVFWRAVREIDIALQICALLLLGVVALSTCIYAVSGMADSVPDGLYRTISVIATGADMRGDNYHGSIIFSGLAPS